MAASSRAQRVGEGRRRRGDLLGYRRGGGSHPISENLRGFAALASLLVILVPSAALSDERFDHRGAVGLLIGSGIEYKQSVSLGGQPDAGLRLPLEVGGTWAIGHDGNELMTLARVSLLGQRLDASIAGGYRGYFGAERFKTFVDLGGSVHFTPAFTVGPRAGVGVQYELASTVGIYSGVAVQLGFGNGIRFNAEAVIGLHLRSYLLE